MEINSLFLIYSTPKPPIPSDSKRDPKHPQGALQLTDLRLIVPWYRKPYLLHQFIACGGWHPTVKISHLGFRKAKKSSLLRTCKSGSPNSRNSSVWTAEMSLQSTNYQAHPRMQWSTMNRLRSLLAWSCNAKSLSPLLSVARNAQHSC